MHAVVSVQRRQRFDASARRLKPAASASASDRFMSSSMRSRGSMGSLSVHRQEHGVRTARDRTWKAAGDAVAAALKRLAGPAAPLGAHGFHAVQARAAPYKAPQRKAEVAQALPRRQDEEQGLAEPCHERLTTLRALNGRKFDLAQRSFTRAARGTSPGAAPASRRSPGS